MSAPPTLFSLFGPPDPTPAPAATTTTPVRPTRAVITARSGAPRDDASVNLFDFDYQAQRTTGPAFTRGMIATANYTHCNAPIPHWHLLGVHPQSEPLRRLWLARAVPVSHYPGFVHVFEESQLTPTGLHAEPPSHHEVEMWLKEHWRTNTMISRMNFRKDLTIYCYTEIWENAGKPGTAEPADKDGRGMYVRYPTLPPEQPLIDLLATLPPTRSSA